MRISCDRREWLRRAAMGAAAVLARGGIGRGDEGPDGAEIRDRAFDFIDRCRRDDGGYAPSPDPSYRGNSDTRLSDLAAVTYAAVLAKTFGRDLKDRDRSIGFIQKHQKDDGRFENLAGEHDARSDLGILYNTTQGVVGLRALGEAPRVDPSPVMARFFERDAFKALPWYTTSFFPLFYAALGRPFPAEQRDALARHLERSQAEDGYVGDHVAAAFHLAHFFRLIGEPTPKAGRMVARVLRDQKADGGWDIKEPDWDVHACFDAMFILRQLGGDEDRVRSAIARGAGWALRCRNGDGGFGHYPGRHSDMDAVYFQLGALIQAGRVPGVADLGPREARTLGWGHAMKPDREGVGAGP